MDDKDKKELEAIAKRIAPEVEKRFTGKDEKRNLKLFLIGSGLISVEKFTLRIMSKVVEHANPNEVASNLKAESIMYEILGGLKYKKNFQITPGMELAYQKFLKVFFKIYASEVGLKEDDVNEINARARVTLSSYAHNEGKDLNEVSSLLEKIDLSPGKILIDGINKKELNHMNHKLRVEELASLTARLIGLRHEIELAPEMSAAFGNAKIEALNIFKQCSVSKIDVDYSEIGIKEIDKWGLVGKINTVLTSIDFEMEKMSNEGIKSNGLLTEDKVLIKHVLTQIEQIKKEVAKLGAFDGTLIRSSKTRLYVILDKILPKKHKLWQRDFMGMITKDDLIAICNEVKTELEFELIENSDNSSADSRRLEISKTLRELLTKVKSQEQKVFLEEAITCYEAKAYRASIVMAWLLTMDVLYEYVMNNGLSDFNGALIRNQKLNKLIIRIKEDFEEMKESEFIMILGSAGIITGNEKKILEEKLGIRNTAAHPNSIIVKESRATNVIEDLVINIISKFQ